jgi:hypothetical protein
MRQITVTKAKLSQTKNGVKLKASFEELMKDGTLIKNDGYKSNANVHPDLIEAFKGLFPHFASLAEIRDSKGEYDIPKVHVHQYSRKGEDEKEGLTLTGMRTTAGNRSYVINTPFLVPAKDTPVYPDMDNLENALLLCDEEVKEFILNDKHGVEVKQLEMDLEGEKERQVIEDSLPSKSRLREITESAAGIIARSLGAINGHKVLEPGAGLGRLVRAIQTSDEGIEVDTYELDETLHFDLECIEGVKVLGKDFFDCKALNRYDRIAAYPPFDGGLDIDFIMHMLKCCKKQGRVVSLVSLASLNGTSKKQKDFKTWLDSKGAIQSPISNAAYDEQGNEIGCALIIIDKK